VFSVSKSVLCEEKSRHPEVAVATEGSQSLEIEILRLIGVKMLFFFGLASGFRPIAAGFS